jgi:hypothetical protein
MAKLSDIKGIGPEHIKALRGAGISTVAQLVEADPVEVERHIGLVTVEQVREWQAAGRALLPAIVQPELVRLRVTAPDGANLPGIGARTQGGHYDLDAAFAALLVSQYPSIFEMEEIK